MARIQAAQMSAAHGSLAADILDLEMKSDVTPTRRRALARVLREVRRSERKNAARAWHVAITARDIGVLGIAALGVMAAAYLVIKG